MRLSHLTTLHSDNRRGFAVTPRPNRGDACPLLLNFLRQNNSRRWRKQLPSLFGRSIPNSNTISDQFVFYNLAGDISLGMLTPWSSVSIVVPRIVIPTEHIPFPFLKIQPLVYTLPSLSKFQWSLFTKIATTTPFVQRNEPRWQKEIHSSDIGGY